MNKKIIAAAALVVIFAVTFLYLNQSYLIANDKDGKNCSNECTEKTSNVKKDCDDKNSIKAGGDYSNYEFTTDKACCEEMKSDLQKNLLSFSGVKEVNFSSTCNVSKMTNVTVKYAAGETNEEAIAKYIKDNSYDCSTKSGCDKDGVKSGNNKNGCEDKSKCPGDKMKKSNDSKEL